MPSLLPALGAMQAPSGPPDSKMELSLLFDVVDQWFSDFHCHTPISRFEESRADDQHKLARISKATLEWFKFLTNPMTDEGINSEPEEGCDEAHNNDIDNDDGHDDDHGDKNGARRSWPCTGAGGQAKPAPPLRPPLRPEHRQPRNLAARSRKSAAPRQANNKSGSAARGQQASLEDLAKDLELMLEQAEQAEQDKRDAQEPLYYPFYRNDEAALLDADIGGSCEVTDQREAPTGTGRCAAPAITWTSLVCSSRDTEAAARQAAHLPQPLTPMPADHEYLARPAAKQTVLCSSKILAALRNKELYRNPRNRRTLPEPDRRRQQLASAKKNSLSVLNEAALKRFAKFSDKFRSMTSKLN